MLRETRDVFAPRNVLREWNALLLKYLTKLGEELSPTHTPRRFPRFSREYPAADPLYPPELLKWNKYREPGSQWFPSVNLWTAREPMLGQLHRHSYCGHFTSAADTDRSESRTFDPQFQVFLLCEDERNDRNWKDIGILETFSTLQWTIRVAAATLEMLIII